MSALEQLIEACATDNDRGLGSQIEAGEPSWFTGNPAPSEKGTVALAQNASVNLIFRVEDITSAHMHDGRYFVSVRGHAKVMISHRKIIRAEEAACACHSGAPATPGQPNNAIAQRTIGGRVDPDADVNYIEDWGCWWRFNCYSVWIPLVGTVRVCIPTGYFCS